MVSWSISAVRLLLMTFALDHAPSKYVKNRSKYRYIYGVFSRAVPGSHVTLYTVWSPFYARGYRRLDTLVIMYSCYNTSTRRSLKIIKPIRCKPVVCSYMYLAVGELHSQDTPNPLLIASSVSTTSLWVGSSSSSIDGYGFDMEEELSSFLKHTVHTKVDTIR